MFTGQIFINLLSNAVKFSKDGGELILRAKLESIGENLQARLQFSVEDCGIGFS